MPCPALSQLWNRAIWLLTHDGYTAIHYASLLEESGVSVYEGLFKAAVERLSVGKERYGFCLVGGIGRREWGCVDVVSVVSGRRVICLDEDMVCALEGASEREYGLSWLQVARWDVILINPFCLRRFIELFPRQPKFLHPKPPPLCHLPNPLLRPPHGQKKSYSKNATQESSIRTCSSGRRMP